MWEDAFGMAEGVIVKHLPDYDHFGMNDIPKEAGNKIIRDWKFVAEHLCAMSAREAQEQLNLAASYRVNLKSEIIKNKSEISAMLQELVTECSKFYQTEEWICILGM